MNFTNMYSDVTHKMKASKIREVMKYTSMPEIISFCGGIPDPQHFAYREINQIIQDWEPQKVQSAMQYGTTTGYPPLIAHLITRMKELKKIDMSNQELIITSGGQQALFLIARIFLNPDDVILVEGPSFIGGIAAFLAHQARPIEIALEEDGINLTLVEEKIVQLKQQGKMVKLLYTIPNFQNPAGTTLSQEKRRKLYDLAIKYSFVIIEDDPYGDLFFEGTADDYLPIKAIGNDAPVLYVSSFSKILCPGFRLGWCIGNKELIEKIGLAKQSIDACSNNYGQVIANDYLEKNIINQYTGKMRKIYKEKKDFMLEMLKKYFPAQVQYTNPRGGFFIYLTLPEKINSEDLFQQAVQQKVAFVTGQPFHIEPKVGERHARLAFSNSTLEQIEKGIKILGQLLQKMMHAIELN